MVIPKENGTFKTKLKPKENLQFRWINLISKSSWIKNTGNGLSYELGVNGDKRDNGNWDTINKNRQNTFYTDK